MSEVLYRPLARSAHLGVVNAAVMAAPSAVWQPNSGRGLRSLQGLAAAAAMGYFVLGLASVLTGF